MSSFLGLSATDIFQDKHLLFTLSSTIMFLVFSYPPLVKTSTRLIINLTNNFIPKTFTEISVLICYSILFGISVYIFAKYIFDRVINTVFNITDKVIRRPENATPPNAGSRNNATPPNAGSRNNATPPNVGPGNNATPPNVGPGNNATPPNVGPGNNATPPNANSNVQPFKVGAKKRR
jgi:hypothetical protein